MTACNRIVRMVYLSIECKFKDKIECFVYVRRMLGYERVSNSENFLYQKRPFRSSPNIPTVRLGAKT